MLTLLEPFPYSGISTTGTGESSQDVGSGEKSAVEGLKCSKNTPSKSQLPERNQNKQQNLEWRECHQLMSAANSGGTPDTKATTPG